MAPVPINLEQTDQIPLFIAPPTESNPFVPPSPVSTQFSANPFESSTPANTGFLPSEISHPPQDQNPSLRRLSTENKPPTPELVRTVPFPVSDPIPMAYSAKRTRNLSTDSNNVFEGTVFTPEPIETNADNGASFSVLTPPTENSFGAGLLVHPVGESNGSKTDNSSITTEEESQTQRIEDEEIVDMECGLTLQRRVSFPPII